MVVYDSLNILVTLLVDWKCVLVGYGEVCVEIELLAMVLQLLPVESWTMQPVVGRPTQVHVQ